MGKRSFHAFFIGQFLAFIIGVGLTSESAAQIIYDNLADDVEPFTYGLESGGTLNKVANGLNFVSNQVGGVVIKTEEGELPASDAWSFRALFTINELTGLGLAGVGMQNPARWAAVLSAAHDQEFGVGEDFRPDKVKVPDGEIFGDPFVVQFDFAQDRLHGHFWRPESPTDVTTIEYSQSLSSNAGPLRLANNGTDTTYHAIWISQSPLPLPTGFEDQGDLNENEILEIDDINVLAEQIRGEGLPEFDLNSDGDVDQDDLSLWINDYYGTWFGDANLDRQVNATDLNALALNWRRTDADSWSQGDFNGDSIVNAADLNALALNWRRGVNAAAANAAVPEPSSVLLLGIGLVGLVVQRHGRR